MGMTLPNELIEASKLKKAKDVESGQLIFLPDEHLFFYVFDSYQDGNYMIFIFEYGKTTKNKISLKQKVIRFNVNKMLRVFDLDWNTEH